MTQLLSKRAAPKRRFIASVIALTLAVLLLSGCALPKLSFGKGAPAAAGSATPAPGATAVAGAAAASATKTSSPVSGITPGEVKELTAADFKDASTALNGLILFTSTSAAPFPDLSVGASKLPNPDRQMWAVSLDGKRAGRISPDGFSSALFAPADSSKKLKVVQYGFGFASDKVDPIVLPDACKDAGDQPCGGFQFSPDGHSLAYFSGPDSCGRTLTLYNLDTRQPLHTWPAAHWFYFLKDGSMSVAVGDCTSQTAYMYIPKTDRQAGIAKVGTPYWNATHTAVIFQLQGKPEIQTTLWGLNLETSRVFLWAPESLAIEDSPVWLADGKHFVFQHRAYRYDASAKKVTLEGPRQIILMDAWTRSQSLLAYDGSVDYHLCPTDGTPCDQPYGDWLQVQRTPFTPLTFPIADRDGKPEVRCALFGQECKAGPEQLAINWQTGKIYPWAEARVPEEKPASLFTGPDVERDPVYQDPAGQFTFYVGKDGRSLWYLPRDREPQLWVSDGETFVYLP